MTEKSTKIVQKRNKYTPQFKDQALALAAKVGIPQAARDLGLAEPMVYAWRAKRDRGNAPLEAQKLQEAEMARLRRECARLQDENAFLKKVAAYFTKESK